jgi:long-chain fatty acid transport protein
MKKINTLRATVVVAVLATGSSAWATDGYFPHGYGMQSLGMGGASVAVTGNTFAGANNPALAAFAGNRYEIGANIFMPKRGASRTGAGPMDGDVESGSSSFLVPEFGYSRQLDAKMAVGLTVYGNGGMNTDYKATGINCGHGAANMLCGNTKLGVNLMQLIVAPTFAYKLSETSAIGVSPLLVYQQFKASGLQAFAGNPGWAGSSYSPSNPAPNTTDNGNDSSKGLGVRLGYTTVLNDAVRFGASYSPKINMSRFKKYSQLFAEGGDFDIPENFAFGFSIQASPAVMLALDYQRINYSKVKSIGNQMTPSGPFPLGSDNGPGFGWADLNVFKVGVEWKQSQNLTLRTGYNHTNNPISGANVTFNIIAPGVITDHYTLGATYKLDDKSDLTFAYMYAPKNTVTGVSGLNPAATETIRMSQQSLGVQYGWKF